MPVEVAIFAMVAGRALAPDSKLSTYQWIKEEVYFPEGKGLELHHFYRGPIGNLCKGLQTIRPF